MNPLPEVTQLERQSLIVNPKSVTSAAEFAASTRQCPLQVTS